jgi:plastocyanin
MSPTRVVAFWCLAAACSSGGPGGYLVQPPPPPATNNPAPTAASVAMVSSSDGYGTATHSFVPATVTIARFGTVTWTNESGYAHNVTFTPRTGAPTNIPDMTAGSASRNFTVAGTFSYRCTNHAGMQGDVVVQ